MPGSRTGQRVAGHEEVRALLRGSGKDGAELEKDLARLLPMKTKTEYEPDGSRSAIDPKSLAEVRPRLLAEDDYLRERGAGLAVRP